MSSLTVDLPTLDRVDNMSDGFDYRTFANDFLDTAALRWTNHGDFKDPGNESWGGVVVDLSQPALDLSDPYKLVGRAFGQGTKWREYALNGARKIYWLLLEHPDATDTLGLAKKGLTTHEPAASAPRGDLRWLPFPHGGAVIVGTGDQRRAFALSAWEQREDHGAATLLGYAAETNRERQQAP